MISLQLFRKLMQTIGFLLISACSYAEMGYNVGYLYLAISETENGTKMTAMVINSTWGWNGHTAVANVFLQSPDGRMASHNDGYAETAEAVAVLAKCTSSGCFDGTWYADSVGSAEYCPEDDQSRNSTVIQDTKIDPGFVLIRSFNAPSTLPKAGGTAPVTTIIEKSPNCSLSAITVNQQIGCSVAGISFTTSPAFAGPVPCSVSLSRSRSFVGNLADGNFTLTVNSNNTVVGKLLLSAHLAATGSCNRIGPHPATKDISVE